MEKNISENTSAAKAFHSYHLEGFEFLQNDTGEENPDKQTVQDKIPEIVDALKTNKFLIVTGDTGCGKSTQIPKLLLNEFQNIILTQPRRVAVINIAKRISADLNCELGSTVGYTMRFKNVSSKNTKLRIVTDGILLNEINSVTKNHLMDLKSFCNNQSIITTTPSPNEKTRKVAGYDLIIIDEAHERTLNIDFLLSYLKNILNSDECVTTKLLIMSATLHTEKFIDYFRCPVIEIKHKRYKIDNFYLEKKLKFFDYVDMCVDTVEKIVEKFSKGDILVFLAGQAEIERAYEILCSSLSNVNVVILQLFSLISLEEQKLVFQKGPRKIILSTNIAETSITIENIKFIVDSGKVKRKRFTDGFNYLETINISKAEAKQRAGRAGRTKPGIVYRLFTHEEYCMMSENSEPEILRSNLSSVILSLKNIGVENIYEFDFIDKLPVSYIPSTISFLKSLQIIDCAENITNLGRFILNLPLAPELSICLYEANRKGCLNSAATIIPFLLYYQSIFVKVKMNSPDYERIVFAKQRFSHPKGDFYKFLNIYAAWSYSRFSKFFLKENFLNIETMYEIKKVRKQLLEFFPRENDTCDDIESAFCCGLFQNVAKKLCNNKYKSLREISNCFIDRNDNLYDTNPNYVLFYDLYYTGGRNYMRNCLKINSTLYENANDNHFIYNLFST